MSARKNKTIKSHEIDEEKFFPSNVQEIFKAKEREVTASTEPLNPRNEKFRRMQSTLKMTRCDDVDGDNNDDDEDDYQTLRLLRLLRYNDSGKNGHNGKDCSAYFDHNENDRGNYPENGWATDAIKESDRKTDFICFACHNPFKQPRTFPCLHTFCSSCISAFQTYPARTDSDRGKSASDYLLSSESESESRSRLVNSPRNRRAMSQSLDRSRRRSSGISSGSRFSLDSRKSDAVIIMDKSSSLFRRRSKHAEVIENCIRRSHSYSDYNLEPNGQPANVQGRSSSAHALTRSRIRHIEDFHQNGNTMLELDDSARNRLISSPRMSNDRRNKLEMINTGNHPHRIVICPICLKETNVSSSLGNLPRNFMIERHVSRDISNQSRTTAASTTCNLCSKSKRRNKHNEKCDNGSNQYINNDQGRHLNNRGVDADEVKFRATIRCEDCGVNMCSHCAALHKIRKKTKRHKLSSLPTPKTPQSSDRSVNFSLNSSSDHTHTSSLPSPINNNIISFEPTVKSKSDPEYDFTEDKTMITTKKMNNKLKKSKEKSVKPEHSSYVNISELRASHRPGLLNSIRRLKLPNMHRFNKLFGFSSDPHQNTSTSRSSQSISQDSGKRAKDKSMNSERNYHDNCYANPNGYSSSNSSSSNNNNNNNNNDNKSGENGLFKAGLVNGGFEDRVTRCPSDGDKMGSFDGGHEDRARTRRRQRPYSDSAASTVRREKPANLPMMCSTHHNEELQMFCVQCNTCVCRECVVERHSQHNYELMTRHLFRSQIEQMDGLIQEVLPVIQRVDKQMTSLADMKTKVEDSSSKVKHEVNEFMDLYVDAIQKQRDVLLSQIEVHAEDKERMLNVTRVHLVRMREEVERTCQFVSDLVTSASDWEILAMKGLITDRLKDLRKMETKFPTGVDSDLRFISSDKGEIINNYQMFGRVIVAKQPCPSKSFFSVEGLDNARMFSPCTSSVTVCDKEGGVIQNGNDVMIKAWVISQENNARFVCDRSVTVYLSNPRDGVRTLTFTPMDKGYHFLHVTLQSGATRNSPYKFFVKRRGQRHTGVFYCCSFCYYGEGKGQQAGRCGCGSTGKAGYSGCYHGNTDHPGCLHWSCCGQTSKESQCALQTHSQGQGRGKQHPVVRQITL